MSEINTKTAKSESLDEGLFYEIEYGFSPIPGVGKFVLKPQKIEVPEKDEIRELFDQMREIARKQRSTYDYSKFFDRRVYHDNALIFYKQGVFMKDFEDNYSMNAKFIQYFPYYQMMGYDQLRTYFTWRTEVRKGTVLETSLSYAFLYIYELISNIGVKDPQEGLDKLMFFWRSFRVYNKVIDKYVLSWIKDYHIYYELPQSFKEFVEKNNLTKYYPNLVDSSDTFDLLCSLSKYNIKKSAFFTDDKIQMITECFSFVVCKVRQIFIENDIDFDEAIFQPTRKMSAWTPFKDALFHQWMKQSDRRIVISGSEIYTCIQNKWSFNTVITSESGRQLIGYIIKQMESTLRRITKYKFKLSANIHTVTHAAIRRLNDAGFSLENIINAAVNEYYREATKTVVKVDHVALSVIRKEALDTQNKLIVPEEEVDPFINKPFNGMRDLPSIPDIKKDSIFEGWDMLKNELTSIEFEALALVLNGGMELKKFAIQSGIMLEVLVDGINGKAMDFIGDNLLDEEFVLYEDYRNQVKDLIG